MTLGKRWSMVILLVLAVCLPLRFAQAAQNVCPWMQAALGNTAIMAAIPDCEGMSQADGHCSLEVICTAVPILNESTAHRFFAAASEVHLAPCFVLKPLTLPPPDRIPIS